MNSTMAGLPADVLDRLRFDELIADLSSQFINLPPDEVDHAIEDALCRVCELLGIDLAVLWQWSPHDPEVIAPTHAYPPVEQVLPPEPLRDEQFPWIRGEILGGRVVSLSSLAEFPPEAQVDCQYCRHYGVKSHLSIPLAVGGEPPVGLIGWNTLQEERTWPDVLVKRLQLVASILTNALARRRHELSLQESEERLAMAADAAGAGLWNLNLDTGVFWATDKGRALFGYTPDEAITMDLFEASVHPEDLELVRGAIERSVRTSGPLHVDYRILAGDGSVRWISSRGRPRFATAGDPKSLMGVSIDITERKRDEEELRASRTRLAAGADLAGLAFYEVDFGEGVMYVDDRLRELCGFPPDRDEGLQHLEFWMEHLHPNDLQRILHMRDQLHDGRLDRFSVEYRYLHPADGERWIRHLAGVARRDANTRAVRTYGVLRDITDRKQVEDELQELSRLLIRAHEEERALLARELHDDVTQRLAVLAIDVGRAELATPDGAQATAMRSVREGLVRLSEDIHSLAYQLHPSVLDELGLAEALRAECDRLRRRSSFGLSLELDPLPAAIANDSALCLFRVAQEALNNVIRHAGARAAVVTLRQVEGGLLLAVRDDGVGFDAASAGKRRSLGLASMRERVRLVDGTLDIESTPGRGTEIVAWVPAQGGSR